jgi:GMP synthase-like glutamine amidotransferase
VGSRSRRALVVMHDHASSSGYVGERLRQRGFELEEVLVVPEERFHDPGVDVDFADPADYDLLVLTGAPWSVYDHERIGSWLTSEVAWLAEAVAADVPVLGICFGAQALATALGGETVRADRPEVGWVDVESDQPALVPRGPWMQWHYDRFVVPPGATELARNEVCPQAYRYERSLGVQFHPEVTADGVGVWLDHGGAEKARELGIDPDDLSRECAMRAVEARRRAHQLVDGFLSDVGGLGPG